MQRLHTMIAAEGWPLVLLSLAVGVLLHYLAGPYVALFAWLAAAIFAYLYRDPYRRVPPLPLAVVSPVDARVVYVKKDHDPYIDRQATHIRLKMKRLGIFGLRSPIEGKLLKQWLYKAGQDTEVPHLPHSRLESVGHYVLWLQSDEQDDVVLILEVAGRWQTPRCYIKPGERIGQGQRCGRTRSGTYVDIFMADNVRMEVGYDDDVLAGASVLATMVH